MKNDYAALVEWWRQPLSSYNQPPKDQKKLHIRMWVWSKKTLRDCPSNKLRFPLSKIKRSTISLSQTRNKSNEQPTCPKNLVLMFTTKQLKTDLRSSPDLRGHRPTTKNLSTELPVFGVKLMFPFLPGSSIWHYFNTFRLKFHYPDDTHRHD